MIVFEENYRYKRSNLYSKTYKQNRRKIDNKRVLELNIQLILYCIKYTPPQKKEEDNLLTNFY